MDKPMNQLLKCRYNLIDMVVDMLREKEGTMRQIDWDDNAPEFVQIDRVQKRLGQIHIEYTAPSGESMVMVLDINNIRK